MQDGYTMEVAGRQCGNFVEVRNINIKIMWKKVETMEIMWNGMEIY